jgi:4-amino-4-deoxy-L-arabinose transferase-like glycosyltransferase
LLATAMFVLGLAGGYYPVVFALLLSLICLAFFRGIPELWRALRAVDRVWADAAELRGWLGTLLVAFAVLFLLSASMVILAPSLAFDVLRYHLAEVQAYNAQHALVILPFLDISYTPQNTELLMTLASGLGGQPAAQMVPPLFFALSLLMVFALARRSGASPLGALAGAIFAGTIPFLHWTGSVAKNDLALAFFVLAALYSYLRWQESGQFAWIELGVFFVAMAAGVKQTALFALPPLAVFYALAAWRQGRRLRAMASLAAIFLAFGLSWYARAWLLTGNPVYPWRLGTAVSPAAARTGPSSAALRYFELPWQLHFEGQKYFASPLANPLGMFFVLFAPVWLLVRRAAANRRPELACLVFTAAYLVYWSVADPELRFACAPILLLAALTGMRLITLYDASARWGKGVILGGAAYVLSFALLAATIVEVNAPQLRLFAGKLDARGYLREALVTFPSLEYLQKQAAPGDRVLSVANTSVAYAPDPAAFDCIIPPWKTGYWPEIESRLGGGGFRFLVAPSNRGEPRESLGAVRLYRDSAFSVYRLPLRNGGKR